MKTNSFETGLSDHHHMIYTILKTKFEKFEPKKLIYCNFKQFDSEQFKLDICNSMSAVRTHAAFENNFVSILEKYAPKKTKTLRRNQKPHFNQNLQKQIMIRSRLKNKANKSKKPVDIAKFKRQRNRVTNLNKQAKLQYFEKLSVDCNSKPFWKACKPYFSNKNSNIQENLMLLEKDKLLSKQKDVASTFNKHFGSITDSLNLFSWPEDASMSSRNDTINFIIKKIACHPSIKAIKKKFKIKSEFSFKLVSTETIKRIINDLDIRKASSGEILTYLVKCDFILDTVTVCVNEALKTGSSPDSLKCTNVRPICKKDDPFDKKNYRPVSILPLLSKVYERVIYKQTSYYFEPFFNETLCRFRKAYSTQHALFKLLTSWQNSLDRRGFVGPILMDLSKSYDCLPHDLLLAKLQAYGFSKESIRLFLSYLTNRTQIIKIGSTFSHWTNIVKGIPQGFYR